MTEEEKKAIEDLKDILKYWQTIVDIKDDVEREIEMNCYSEEMPFEQLKIALNLIEKLQKENEERKSEIEIFYKWLSFTCKELGISEDTPIIDMLSELKNNYIPKSKIKNLEEAKIILHNIRAKNIQASSCSLADNDDKRECGEEIEAIDVVLEELDKKDKVDRQKKLIDLMHCEIVYYVDNNDGYYWNGIVVLKYKDKYCVVEYKGSGSGYISNQIESVDKEFLDDAIYGRKLYPINYDRIDPFPCWFNTFLESIYGNYALEKDGYIMEQLKEQEAVLLDFEDIEKYI